MKSKLIVFLGGLFILFYFSCSKKNTIQANLIWNDTVYLSSKSVIPAVANRNETGIAELSILSDNTLQYSILINSFSSSDMVSSLQIFEGNAGSNGKMITELNGTIIGNSITGSIQLSTAKADSIKKGETYLILNTNLEKKGLLRGQINNNVVFAADVIMNGSNEVPPISTTAMGLATIRMTENKTVYIKVDVNNLETGETLAGSHIHAGNATVNGVELLVCYSNESEFGSLKKIKADDTFYASILSSPMYIHAFTLKRSNLIRGQIR